MKSWPLSFLLSLACLFTSGLCAQGAEPAALAKQYSDEVRPLLTKYCLACHSEKEQEGELDLERFASLANVRADLKPWPHLVEQLEAREMPPKDKPQPTAAERKLLINWTRGMLEAEARAQAGDPGHVPLHRLSNAEYDRTVHDLTGVDLRPAREFPVDGAAGEGFTNAAEALTMSPALMAKYLAAAKDISAHAVLLPDGFRFAPGKSRRDWTDESLTKLRAFYGQFADAEGRLPLPAYLMATVRHREALRASGTTLEAVAAKEKLNAKYLTILWNALTDKEHANSFPLATIRARWQTAEEKDVSALIAEIAAWQQSLWKVVPIGSYRYGNVTRQVANDPVATEQQTLRVKFQPAPGQSEVVLYLAANAVDGSQEGEALWQMPRFEGANQPPLLLSDYASFGPKYEIDFTATFRDTARYLAAVVAATQDREAKIADVAKKNSLDAELLRRWVEVLALEPLTPTQAEPTAPGRAVPAVALQLLDEKTPRNNERPAINGWKPKGADLPVVISNNSDKPLDIPSHIEPHHVAMHPLPTQFVAAVWRSPIAGKVRAEGKVAHVHDACGNGIAWRLEYRQPTLAAVLAEGTIDRGGKPIEVPPQTLTIAAGDQLILMVDARDKEHTCDMTDVALTITEVEKPARIWSLVADVADSILDANPHADKHGNKEVWSFVQGPSQPINTEKGPRFPADSLVGKWRAIAMNPAKKEEAGKLAEQIQTLLTGARPTEEKHPDRVVYDDLLALNGQLLRGVDFSTVAKPAAAKLGLPEHQFDKDGNVHLPLGKVVEVRLPATLFLEREFVVDAKLAASDKYRVAQFQATTAPPPPAARWDGAAPLVRSAGDAGQQQWLAGLKDFREAFPLFVCYPHVIPLDEVVCLKTFHREDEPLIRLMLTDEQTATIDRLWHEHRFITKYPIVENEYLPLFIGFVTQDQPKELLAYFEGQRPTFKKWADEFAAEFEAAAPQQLTQLLDFASHAYRRPLTPADQQELRGLYQSLRAKEVPHEDALRDVLARILVSPAFLLHLEKAAPGNKPHPVNDWELASRLSYFLWSTAPDDKLRELAAAGKLHEPSVLAEQTDRMLKDDRVRALSIEFGTQWIHVRGFDNFNEKNEKLYPTFNADLRAAIYEESILFFQDLFQQDRSVQQILDADYTYLNEPLAQHYGIPDVKGQQWRRVEGVKKHGRGGILALASVQSRQAGASRTSPILRGNWVVETLLGEKLPLPPPNIPQLPEEEGGSDGLSMRQLVEKHVSAAECATCHQRIDPYGFSLEKYDAIGRLRDKDLGGLALDTKAKLRDGTEFEGIDGLRTYLLTQKRAVFERLFCRRLLGYALGRQTTIADQALLDEMLAEMKKNDGRVTALVHTIVRSPQFKMARGSDFVEQR
jgi:hypothetical protein